MAILGFSGFSRWWVYSAAKTVIFYYAGGARAAEVPSGAAVRRQAAYDGPAR